ncbi:MAG: mandelate racemase/muconate lactonizing enzyme family protein [Acidimicrobiales bacterium]|nr:mandelate racemase/muconate lactonizing enzyme family protein [Acidimicrobiales bacterium]MBO0885937.1 mandelate racemase/muconate lactonizing enzyme family protein [Acidimicrobiales bacterium]MBO0893266.1 mandelate racemase/muconate lactonizing enzyme family protein [Acidimicrobiales bacterium]
MKVTGVRTFPVEVPPPHHGGRTWMFLRVDTDAGISGYGEVMLLASAFRLPVVASMIDELAERQLIGHDPCDIEALWDRVYGRAGYSHYPEQTKLALLSGLEMACWDILGKDVGRPVYRLLGGRFRDRVRTYTYIYADPADERWTREQLWLHPEPTAERARYYADLGFNGVKLDPFGAGISFDQGLGQVIPVEYSLKAMDTAEATIRAVREAVGDRCDILVGTHGQMTAAGAIRVAKRLEPYDPLWFEEPVPPENMAEMARVAHATSIPITTGERLTTKYDFARLIAHQAAAIFNLDVGQVGGILETKKIAALAEAAYLHISPHVYGGPIIAAASVQVATCCPNFLIMESIERCDGFYAELIDPPLEWRDSYLIPSERPGLGHDLNEEVAARHAPGA